jgi:hypothetical protein
MARAPIKDRQITIYVPKLSDVARWHSLSRAKGISLSSWVFEHVELSLEKQLAPRPTTNASKQLRDLHREISDLKRENAQLLKMNSQLIESRRADADTIPRIKLLEEAVKGLLQRGGTWSDKKLRKALETSNTLKIEPVGRIEPFPHLDDIDAAIKRNVETGELKLLGAALQNLVNSGLIEESERGFKWKT